MFVQIHNRFVWQGLQVVSRNLSNNIQQPRVTRQILDEFDRDPTTSTRRVSIATGTSQSKVVRVLRRDFRHAYHLQPVQGLQPGDELRRVNFCRWILNSLDNNRDFLSHILWTDELCFTRRGVVNFHNQHVWANENPHAIRPRKFQNSFSVNVWIGVIHNNLCGPFFCPIE